MSWGKSIYCPRCRSRVIFRDWDPFKKGKDYEYKYKVNMCGCIERGEPSYLQILIDKYPYLNDYLEVGLTSTFPGKDICIYKVIWE